MYLCTYIYLFFSTTFYPIIIDIIESKKSTEAPRQHRLYLDRRVEHKVLPSRQRLELGIELRAVAHQPVDLLRVLAHVEPAQVRRTRRGR